MRRLISIGIYVFISLFSYVAFGNYLKTYSLDELVKKSSYIVRAQVIAVDQKAYDFETKMPYTRTTLKITYSMKGNLASSSIVEVIQVGGLMPDNSFVAEVGAAQFEKGEDVVVFLNVTETEYFGRCYVTSVMSQSKFIVSDGNVYRNQDTTLRIRKESVEKLISKETPISLDEFLVYIGQSILAEGN